MLRKKINGLVLTDSTNRDKLELFPSGKAETTESLTDSIAVGLFRFARVARIARVISEYFPARRSREKILKNKSVSQLATSLKNNLYLKVLENVTDLCNT
jgi:hypothetical protein